MRNPDDPEDEVEYVSIARLFGPPKAFTEIYKQEIAAQFTVSLSVDMSTAKAADLITKMSDDPKGFQDFLASMIGESVALGFDCLNDNTEWSVLIPDVNYPLLISLRNPVLEGDDNG